MDRPDVPLVKMRAVSITGHLGGHRSNAPHLTDIGAIRRCCRTWPFFRSAGYVDRLHSGPVVAMGAGRIFCRTGAFAYLHATPRHFTPDRDQRLAVV